MFKYLFILNLIFIQLEADLKSIQINSFDLLHDFTGKQTNSLNLFKKIYNINQINDNNIDLIPKKIHQIWIGPKALPDKFSWMQKSIKELHPTWEYKLWTNDDLKSFNLKNERIFNSMVNIGAKADIFRYEILERFGGIYIDIDFELLKPLDNLIKYEFFGCLLCGTDLVSNGIIGSRPNHPILQESIEMVSKINQFDNKGDNTTILNMTGPYFLTNIIIKYLIQTNQKNIIIFPSDYFFPFPATLRESFWNNNLTRENVLQYAKTQTLGIHYWATSWQD